jgi:hypothetical protein
MIVVIIRVLFFVIIAATISSFFIKDLFIRIGHGIICTIAAERRYSDLCIKQPPE